MILSDNETKADLLNYEAVSMDKIRLARETTLEKRKPEMISLLISAAESLTFTS
jgi:hypothetical protein